MRQTVAISTLAMGQVVLAGLYPGITLYNHTCALADPILSCSPGANPDKVDTCCVETFGGLVLQTQFWSTFTGRESEGQLLPRASWGIHGLWPDFCNGSYTQYCDLSRQYDPKPSPNTTNGKPDGTPVPAYTGESIANWFAPYGKEDLLAYMEKFWINQYDPNWMLWAHEYSKHATCFSTFQTECYGPKAPKYADLFEFFETVIYYFRQVPTWSWLANAGIRPSNTTSYTLSDIQGVLTKEFGQLPFLGCSGPRFNETAAGKGSLDNGRTQLSEVWYYHTVYGAPQRIDAKRLPATAAGNFLTTCAKADKAVWYYERAKGSQRGCSSK
ncbi:Putative Ribonuclease T2 family protein [[Torrubiella] hemipterigena]|uniref:ribonuclease T2 n=1 Tax=[Torrubiella] hemipterigena TaxID=1531966 RepID=A0A0A1TBC6_9HYPO|nr:Putative Ribonuclease T2 family protein [[Torrubiella] hemipterigena]